MWQIACARLFLVLHFLFMNVMRAHRLQSYIIQLGLSQKSDILILSKPNCEILHEQLLLVCFLIGEIITVVFTSLVCDGGPMS